MSTTDILSDWIVSPDDPPSWFAVRTRTRFEKRVASDFREKGIETFLPLYTVKHKWSDRQRLVHLPLFPAYVFVRMQVSQEIRVSVLRTVGVTGFVGARGLGTPIPDGEIQTIQTVLERRAPFQLYPFLNVGQLVRVRGGCLDGIEGILTAIQGNESLVVSVQLIQKSIALQIRGYEVEPVRSAAAERIAALRVHSLGANSKEPRPSVNQDIGIYHS